MKKLIYLFIFIMFFTVVSTAYADARDVPISTESRAGGAFTLYDDYLSFTRPSSAENAGKSGEVAGDGAFNAFISITAPDVGALNAFISITAPDVGAPDSEIVYKNTYSICGVRDDLGSSGAVGASNGQIVLFLTRLDPLSGEYAEAFDINGESRWIIGANGVFARSVLLEEGENLFAIAACKASVAEEAEAESGIILSRDMQIINITIIYRSQSVAEKIGEMLKDLSIVNILKEIEKK